MLLAPHPTSTQEKIWDRQANDGANTVSLSGGPLLLDKNVHGHPSPPSPLPPPSALLSNPGAKGLLSGQSPLEAGWEAAAARIRHPGLRAAAKDALSPLGPRA